MGWLVLFFLMTSYSNLTFEEEPIPPCVVYKGYSFNARGNVVLNFYNQCGTRMVVNVCVTDQFGEKQLHQSIQRISHNGWFKVIPFDVRREPAEVNWSYGLNDALIPGTCGA